MARTAPVPNIPPIPGMCPSIAVMGGGAGGGGGSGDGAGDGEGNGPGDGSGNSDAANGDGTGANACGTGNAAGCPNPTHGGGGHVAAGDPIDPATGRVFTAPFPDLVLGGPLPLHILRAYSSCSTKVDVGLGWGWSHSLGWSVVERRDHFRFRAGLAGSVRVPKLEINETRAVGVFSVTRDANAFRIVDKQGITRVLFQTRADASRYTLALVQDRFGNRIQIEADDEGIPVTIVDSGYRVIRTERDANQRIGSFQVQQPDGSWAGCQRYEYDEAGNLVGVVDNLGHRAIFSYDEAHRLTKRRLRDGLEVHYVYDAKGRGCETWAAYPGVVDPCLMAGAPEFLADGLTRAKGFLHVRIAFDRDYAEVTTSRQVKRYEFGPHGGVTGGWAGATNHLTYNDHGGIRTYEDAVGAVWRWETDSEGLVQSATDPIGGASKLRYDANNDVKELVDQTGGFVRYERDLRGGLTAVADDLGDVVRYERDARGLILRAHMPNGGPVSFAIETDESSGEERMRRVVVETRCTPQWSARCPPRLRTSAVPPRRVAAPLRAPSRPR